MKDIWDLDHNNPENEIEITICLNCGNNSTESFCSDWCKIEYKI